VNDRRPWWLIFSLLPPLIALCGLLIPFGCGSGGGSSPIATGTPAEVTVALIGVAPPGNFRSVLLNVSGIRINKLAHAQSNSGGWTTIAVPTSAGTGNAQNPGDLQIDLLQTQTGAVAFNNAGAEPGTYNTIQVLLDQTNPGTIVPACPSGPGNTEGCITYPLTFDTINSPNGNLQPILLDLATPISVSANTNTPIIIQLALSIIGFPINVGDSYVAAITASEVNSGSFLAPVTGAVTVTGSATATMLHIAPLSVVAELTGTNTPIQSIPVRKAGAYTLELPAAPTGTTYDLYVLGDGVEYKTFQGLTVFPGQAVLGMDFKVVQTNSGNLSGFIADARTGLGIPGAEIELLAPDQATAVPTSAPPASFCRDNPEQCVVVATGTADQNGSYPMPGTVLNPNTFTQFPVGTLNLAVRVTASGYTPLISSAYIRPLAKTQECSAATSPTVCSFSLTTGLLNGTVQLATDPPPGASTMVQVFAENSGTNQIVSALSQPLTFIHSETSQNFSMNVPLNSPGNSFDLFAVAIDPYVGAPDPFPGHDIQVLANQPGPADMFHPSTLPPFAPMNCVGHGSISGTVVNPDIGASVEVEKLDPSTMAPVQILGTSPALFSSTIPGNNDYTLCVPPDNYQLQRFEAPSPMPGVPTPEPAAVGTPQMVMVPAPAATSSPCPSSCSSTDTGIGPCPGLCQNTPASPL
jgi:hypothetical protein